MKVLFANRTFDSMAGGIERIASLLMNHLCEQGHEVCLLTFDRAGAKSFYPLHPAIRWETVSVGDFKRKATIGEKFQRFQKVRAIARDFKPDVILGLQHGMFLPIKIATLGLGIPTVCAERNAPHRYDFIKDGKKLALIYPTFLLADAITIQFEGYKERYPHYLHSRMATIPNPVFPRTRFATPEGLDGHPKTLLCVARLGFQKNQIALVKAFAKVSDEFPEWTLILAGDGEDKDILMALANEYGVKNRVRFPGAVKDVESLYCESHLFCMPSQWEGFPNAVAESLSYGLPVVGYDGCAGVRDLIHPFGNGLLAAGNGDVDSLAETLRFGMRDGALRGRMGQNAIESVKAYTPALVLDQWEAFLKKTGRAA